MLLESVLARGSYKEQCIKLIRDQSIAVVLNTFFQPRQNLRVGNTVLLLFS